MAMLSAMEWGNMDVTAPVSPTSINIIVFFVAKEYLYSY
jgi:hypothetical protein